MLDDLPEDWDSILEGVGVDPHHTPVDNLPEHGAWALARQIKIDQGEDPEE